MGFLENRRRKAHRESVNWDLLVNLMVLGHELGLAEEDGITDNDAKGDRAARVRDAVTEVIDWDHLIEVFINTDYELSAQGKDKDAVTDRALEDSGYNAARRRLFGSPEASSGFGNGPEYETPPS